MFEATLTGITTDGSTWPDGSEIATFSFSGTRSADGAIEGSYAGAGDSGAVLLDKTTGPIGDSRVRAVEGMWVLRDASQNIIATYLISQNGQRSAVFEGSHVNGCVFSGEIEDWSSMFVYDFDNLEISGCPIVDGTSMNGNFESFSGLAAPIKINLAGTTGDFLAVVVSDDRRAITLILESLD